MFDPLKESQCVMCGQFRLKSDPAQLGSGGDFSFNCTSASEARVSILLGYYGHRGGCSGFQS